MRKGYLKKQSQFAGGQNGVNSFMKGEYEEKQAVWARKNKANSKPIKANFMVQSITKGVEKGRLGDC